jgi:hypothetical protein
MNVGDAVVTRETRATEGLRLLDDLLAATRAEGERGDDDPGEPRSGPA